MRSTLFWDVMPRNLIGSTEVTEEHTTPIFRTENCRLLDANYLPGLLFNPQDGECMFIQNTGKILLDYTALHARRYYSS
jgi:hypothetical protein